TTLNRNINIESTATAGVLSLTPTELGLIGAGTLEIGRTDGTGTLSVNASLLPTNVNASTLRLLDGTVMTAAFIGSVGTPFNHNLEIQASNSIAVNGGIQLTDNENLTLVANTGSLSISGNNVIAGSSASNTGTMTLTGQNVTVSGA